MGFGGPPGLLPVTNACALHGRGAVYDLKKPYSAHQLISVIA